MTEAARAMLVEARILCLKAWELQSLVLTLAQQHLIA